MSAPRLACHVQTWGAVRLRAAGAGALTNLHFESRAPFHQALTDIRLAGFDGVEVFDGDLLAWSTAGHRVADMGLELCGVYVGGYLIYEELWPEERLRIARTMDTAAAAGCTNVVLGVGGVHADGVRPGDLGRIARRLDTLAEDARAAGLRAHYHPHPGAGGHTPADIDAVLAATSLSLCPDMAVLRSGGVDPLAFVRRYASRIDYAHLKDNRRGVDVEVGQGDIDMRGIISALTPRAGWLVTELDSSYAAPVESARVMAGFVRSAIASRGAGEESPS
jgi:inosose dehydratase